VTLEQSQAGQALAQGRREALIGARRTFVAESTFSHPSKLDLLTAARSAGYRLVVYHLNLRDPEHAVLRVRGRAAQGGHSVPEDRIRGRYQRNPPLIRQAVLAADHGYVFDASRLGEPPELLLIFQGGRAAQIARSPPTWAVELYGSDVA
jgi:predicted ABC-type ATPase